MYLPFNKMKKPALGVSAFLVLCSIFLCLFRGFNFSIDFTGGIIMEFRQEGEEISVQSIREVLKNMKIEDYSVQQTQEEMIIKIGTKQKADYASIIERIKSVIFAEFTKTDVEFTKIDFVSPKIGKELALKGFIAVFASLFMVLIYISVRFEFRYSIGAILALMHDVILTFGFISLFAISFDVATIAGILTVVGYSINDSVVIFDRIRENFKAMKIENGEIIEKSLNATLTRTIITSLTTLIAILAIILIGGAILKPFALVIFFGILIGTLSSIFIAPLFLFNRKLN
jgi:preprotein translocase subunit SecF